MALTAGKRARPKATLSNKNSGIVWSEASFKEYLEDPQGKMPGTKMIFSDKNEKEVADLWAYLKQFGADGKKKSQ
jgi:cytochrome c